MWQDMTRLDVAIYDKVRLVKIWQDTTTEVRLGKIWQDMTR